VNVLFKNKKDIIESFRHIPISKSTNTKNTVVLIKDNHKLLKQDLYTVDFYNLVLEESCIITDKAQLTIHVRYINKISGKFYEE